MNRAGRRARRRATVSTKLLQSKYEDLAKEAQQMRCVLFAILKEQGRVRVKQETIDGLDESDGINAELVAGTYIITYQNYPERKNAS